MPRLRFVGAAALLVCLGATVANAATTWVVHVGPGFSLTFSPANLTIAVGDSVQWTWVSGFHNVTSTTAEPFQSVTTTTGTYTYTFANAGHFPYYCSVHGLAMSGTVNVKHVTATSVVSSKPSTLAGESATLTATVASADATALVPTGSVTFRDAGDVIVCDSIALDASATTTCSTAPLSVGVHAVTAEYSGDSNFFNSTSDPILQTVKGATTTDLIASKNPAAVCENVTFTATPAVVPPGSVVGGITGTVTFADYATPLCTTSLASGIAHCVASLAAGVHSITASYDGNTLLNASTSAPLSQTIEAAAVAAPAFVAATAQTGKVVKVEWPPVPGATSYEIGRRAVRTDADTIIPLPATCGAAVSYFDLTPNTDAAYIYRVRAIGLNVSAWSNPDVAVTFYLSNPPASNLLITAADMNELRHAVNLVHAVAGYVTDITFTNDPLTPNVSQVSALDLIELRRALTDALGLIGITAAPYTDPDEDALQNRTVRIKASHFTEIQRAVQ
jgi:plastocyanin